MGEFVLTIRGEVPVSTAMTLLRLELIRRCASEMHAADVVGGSSSCMLAGPEKGEFQYWCIEHAHHRPLGSPDPLQQERMCREWGAHS